MRTKLRTGAVGACFLLLAVPVRAHHSFAAEFDANQPITLRGTVTMVEFINPHAWIHVSVKGEDGKVAVWMIEGGTPNVLLRKGLTKDSLAVGTEVVIEGYRSKTGKTKANGRDITLADGRKVFMGSSGTGAPLDGRDPSEKK